MKNTMEQLQLMGLVPVVKLDDAKDAVPLAKALIAGGLPCAEITFRTDAAEESIRQMTQAFPDMLVGAGTVLTIEQVDRAIDAGASFVVCPGFNEKIVNYCLEKGVLVTPGCTNPTDMSRAVELGLKAVKFFPAEQSGGIGAIKAMSSVFGGLKFMPTGGVSAKNLGDYLSFDKILACGGSWMVNPALISAGKFDEIEALTREAVQAMLGFKIAHVGINCENEGEAQKTAQGICNLFGFPVKDGSSSVFAGSAVEVMKSPFLGKNGHIAFGTYHVDRAKAYLERQGFAFKEDTAKFDGAGNLMAIYLDVEIGGFALHLVKQAY